MVNNFPLLEKLFCCTQDYQQPSTNITKMSLTRNVLPLLRGSKRLIVSDVRKFGTLINRKRLTPLQQNQNHCWLLSAKICRCYQTDGMESLFKNYFSLKLN